MSIEHAPLTSVSKFTRVRFLDWKKAKRTGNFSRTEHSQKNGVGSSGTDRGRATNVSPVLSNPGHG